MCKRGAREVREHVVGELSESDYRLVIIWSNILDNDSFQEAMKQASKFPSDRVIHFWDPQTIAPKAYRETLGWGKIAWDIYMMYGRGKIEWGDSPPAPDRWFYGHQKRDKFPEQHVSGPKMGPRLHQAMSELIQEASSENGPPD